MDYEQYIGKEVKIIRDGTDKEWAPLGRVGLNPNKKKFVSEFRIFSGIPSFRIDGVGWIPCAICFEINEFNYEIY